MLNIEETSVTPAGLDKLAFTIPLESRTNEQIYDFIESIYKMGKWKINPCRVSSMYRKSCEIELGGKKNPKVKIEYLPRANMNVRPVRVELNPNNFCKRSKKKLIKILMKLLRDDFSLIWSKANITRLDGNLDFIGYRCEQVGITLDKATSTYNLDKNGQIMNIKASKAQDIIVASCYQKSDAVRLEVRLNTQRISKGITMSQASSLPSPFDKLDVYSTEFSNDPFFDPGFYDCVVRRTLQGALNHYQQRDPQVAGKYRDHIREHYGFKIYDPDVAWESFLNSLEFLEIFRS